MPHDRHHQADDFGTPTTNLGAMTCPLASSFTDWARYGVAPAAKHYLGSEVVKIETMAHSTAALSTAVGLANCPNMHLRMLLMYPPLSCAMDGVSPCSMVGAAHRQNRHSCAAYTNPPANALAPFLAPNIMRRMQTISISIWQNPRAMALLIADKGGKSDACSLHTA